MKPILCIVAATLMLFVTLPDAQALFGHVAAERERRIDAQQQLQQQQQTTAHLYIAVSVLSAGVVISLVIGTAVGSKSRRDRES